MSSRDVLLAGPVERKLTTIFCADVKEYSRLMEEDEVATLDTLRAYRTAMVGFIERHRGRLVSTAGDSLLAEFPSVVESVMAAAEIQQELGARNAELTDHRKMEFRIGINLGDVMVEEGDIFGEGVNVAARLQGLAEGGGICISGTVYDQVRNKLTLGFDFVGERSVKNISEKIPVYRVAVGGTSTARPAADSVTAGGARTGEDPDADERGPRGQDEAGPAHAGIRDEIHKARDEIREELRSEIRSEVLRDVRSRLRAVRGRRRSTKDRVGDLGRSVARMAAILIVLFVIDALAGGGWWVQWPALVASFLIAFKAVGVFLPKSGTSPGKAKLRFAARAAVIVLFLFFIDLLAGPGWWVQWPLLAFGVIVAFRLAGP